jgi:hypothetical protein
LHQYARPARELESLSYRLRGHARLCWGHGLKFGPADQLLAGSLAANGGEPVTGEAVLDPAGGEYGALWAYRDPGGAIARLRAARPRVEAAPDSFCLVSHEAPGPDAPSPELVPGDALRKIALAEQSPVRRIKISLDMIESISASRDPNMSRLQVSLWTSVGMALRDLGRLKGALDAFETALAISERHDPANVVSVRELIARAQAGLPWPVGGEDAAEGEHEKTGAAEAIAFEQQTEAWLLGQDSNLRQVG